GEEPIRSAAASKRPSAATKASRRRGKLTCIHNASSRLAPATVTIPRKAPNHGINQNPANIEPAIHPIVFAAYAVPTEAEACGLRLASARIKRITSGKLNANRAAVGSRVKAAVMDCASTSPKKVRLLVRSSAGISVGIQ